MAGATFNFGANAKPRKKKAAGGKGKRRSRGPKNVAKNNNLRNNWS